MFAKIATLPGALQEYALEEGATVRTLVELSESDAENYGITVNGLPVDLDSPLNDGDKVILSKAAKGNS